MKRVTLVKALVSGQDEALEFYTKKLASKSLKITRWATTAGCWCACLTTMEICINLDAAKTGGQRALVGRQATPSTAQPGSAAGHERTIYGCPRGMYPCRMQGRWITTATTRSFPSNTSILSRAHPTGLSGIGLRKWQS